MNSKSRLLTSVLASTARRARNRSYVVCEVGIVSAVTTFSDTDMATTESFSTLVAAPATRVTPNPITVTVEPTMEITFA